MKWYRIQSWFGNQYFLDFWWTFIINYKNFGPPGTASPAFQFSFARPQFLQNQGFWSPERLHIGHQFLDRFWIDFGSILRPIFNRFLDRFLIDCWFCQAGSGIKVLLTFGIKVFSQARFQHTILIFFTFPHEHAERGERSEPSEALTVRLEKRAAKPLHTHHKIMRSRCQDNAKPLSR